MLKSLVYQHLTIIAKYRQNNKRTGHNNLSFGLGPFSTRLDDFQIRLLMLLCNNVEVSKHDEHLRFCRISEKKNI